MGRVDSFVDRVESHGRATNERRFTQAFVGLAQINFKLWLSSQWDQIRALPRTCGSDLVNESGLLVVHDGAVIGFEGDPEKPSKIIYREGNANDGGEIVFDVSGDGNSFDSVVVRRRAQGAVVFESILELSGANVSVRHVV